MLFRSKRNGAKAVTQYRDEGYLADAMINYLARLGWSHGDDEIFSREQFLAWFDLDHLGKSAAQFDEAKLRWVNAQHIKAMPDAELAPLVAGQLQKRGIAQTDERLPAICALFKDRCETTEALAGWARAYYADVQPPQQELDQFVTDAIRPAIASLHDRLKAVSEWNAAAISAAVKQTLAEHGLKLMFAAHNRVDNLIATIDYNNRQIDGDVDKVLSLGNLPEKLKAFGWEVLEEKSGNDIEAVISILEKAKQLTGKGKPIAIVLHTEMGAGVDFMMGTNAWHGKTPNDEQLAKALEQPH